MLRAVRPPAAPVAGLGEGEGWLPLGVLLVAGSVPLPSTVLLLGPTTGRGTGSTAGEGLVSGAGLVGCSGAKEGVGLASGTGLAGCSAAEEGVGLVAALGAGEVVGPGAGLAAFGAGEVFGMWWASQVRGWLA